tara:strand:- start:401 stop:583 length:183 start_codon:yes stop_codon:yes gene_type:complete
MVYVVIETNLWEGQVFEKTRLFSHLEKAEEFYNSLVTYNMSKQLLSFSSDKYELIHKTEQ